MNCQNCGVELENKKTGAKFCSTNCRVTFSRKSSVVTDSVTFSKDSVTDSFKYTNHYDRKPGDAGYDEELANNHKQVKEAKYWYDVPLNAIPVKQKGWPDMPENMNGRQYFLWWKNEFKVQENDGYPGVGLPEITNPFPTYEKLQYFQAGDNSRRWGA